jgi:PKD domain
VFAIVAVAWPGTVVAGQTGSCQPGPGSGVGVNIHVAGMGDIWCAASDIEAEAIKNPARNPLDPSGPPLTNAISIRNLLKIAGVPPRSVHLVLLSRSNGVPSTLDHGELVGPAASFTGGLPPIVEVVGAQIEYIRPSRNPPARAMSQADINSETITQTPLDLSLFLGPALNAGITVGCCSSTKQPGKPVQFSAYPTGSGLSYAWNFGDGPRPGGVTISHTFNQLGSHSVYVTVRGSDGSAGVGWASVNIEQPRKVPAVKKKNKTSGNGNGNGTTGGAGVNGSTGNGNTNNNNNNTNNNSNGTNNGSNNSTYPYGNTYTNPTPTTHTHTRSRIKSSGLGQHGGTIVNGRLISDVTPVSAAQLARGNVPALTPVNQRFTQTSVLDNATVKPIAALLAALAIVLLLSSGAGRELRSLRRSIASARLG